MQPRIAYWKYSGEPLKALTELEEYLKHSTIEPKLFLLVKMRASQMNGCAYCIDMHSKDARAGGETEQRLYELNAWRETPFYTDRERAALAWTESVTEISKTHADDATYELVREHFSEQEFVDLTWAIVAINAWNRIAISCRAVPGHYKATEHAAAV